MSTTVGEVAARINVAFFISRVSERVYLRAYDTVNQARGDIAEYIDWYNTQRGHTSLDKRTPDQAYWQMLPKMKMAA